MISFKLVLKKAKIERFNKNERNLFLTVSGLLLKIAFCLAFYVMKLTANLLNCGTRLINTNT